MEFLNRLLISLIIVIRCMSETVAQSHQSTIEMSNYFTERLRQMDEETSLIPYTKMDNLKARDVEKAKSFVWNTWKTQVLEIDSLPTAMEISHNQQDIYPHIWQLKKEDPLPFYYIKKGEAKNNKYALFLNLHGSGPKVMEFKNTLGWTLRYEDSPSIYFIPQIPSEERYRWWYKPVQYAWERLFRLAMVEDEIDVNKIYVMGISEGGYGSQRLDAFYGDYLAGAGPMAGGEPLKNAPPLNFRNIAFSLQTGELDTGFGRNKLTLAAKNEFEKLAAENDGEFIHNIVLQPNRGHGIDYTVTTPWLVKYSRNPYPKHISWVLFPMDGRYRKGFYNLALDKELSIKEGDEFDRIAFDIQYDKNTIHIQAHLMDNEMFATQPIRDLEFSLFLDDNYINLNKKVSVYLNDKLVYNKKVKLNYANMVESCALFADPERIFPAKISLAIHNNQ